MASNSLTMHHTMDINSLTHHHVHVQAAKVQCNNISKGSNSSKKHHIHGQQQFDSALHQRTGTV